MGRLLENKVEITSTETSSNEDLCEWVTMDLIGLRNMFICLAALWCRYFAEIEHYACSNIGL